MQSGGGDISVRATGNVPIFNGGITSEGGDILVYAADILELDLPTPIRSGSNSVDGGSIILHAVNAMTIGGAVSSESGTGGVYYVEDGVTVDTEPVLGSGDISFYLRSVESFLPLIEESTPVPTLPVYLLLVLSGLLALFALPRMRALNR